MSLPPQIQPLNDDFVVVGRAMTVLEADCTGDRFAVNNNIARGENMLRRSIEQGVSA